MIAGCALPQIYLVLLTVRVLMSWFRNINWHREPFNIIRQVRRSSSARMIQCQMQLLCSFAPLPAEAVKLMPQVDTSPCLLLLRLAVHGSLP